ncbi:MAG: glycosyltransferase [Acidothermaceae bacterium]
MSASDQAAHVTADITVVLACHTADRWNSIVAAVESARAQQLKPASIVVSVDHNRFLGERLRGELNGVEVVDNDSRHRGASATRNAGAAAARTNFVAFLDDDETAAPDWITALIAPFADPAVVGTGGLYRPNWLARKPAWFPDEFAWAVGGSFTGMPTEPARVRNVWSGNMAVRTAAFRAVGGFRGGFGKLAGQSRPEDTDLCIRVAAASRGHWVYVPDAVIEHEVPANRSTFAFFIRRSFAEGKGKIEMRAQLANSLAGGHDSHGGHVRAGTLANETSYLTHTLPRGFVRHLCEGAPGFARSGAIAIGVVAAGAGAATAVLATLGTAGRRSLAEHQHSDGASSAAAPTQTATAVEPIGAVAAAEPVS